MLMKNILSLIAILTTLLTLAACSSNYKLAANEEKFYIAATTRPCNAGVMETECILYKASESQAEWHNLYSPIKGFKYEKGFEYELIVKKTTISNPPADASSIQYELIKLLRKTKR